MENVAAIYSLNRTVFAIYVLEWNATKEKRFWLGRCKMTSSNAQIVTWSVEGFYTNTYGWEPVTYASSWDEAARLLKDYRAAEPTIRFRVSGGIQQ